MTTKTDDSNPTTDDYRREVLEENQALFERIRDSDRISDSIRYKYGQRPLEKLEELTEEGQ